MSEAKAQPENNGPTHGHVMVVQKSLSHGWSRGCHAEAIALGAPLLQACVRTISQCVGASWEPMTKPLQVPQYVNKSASEVCRQVHAPGPVLPLPG
jgi:hypothetical protein